MAGRPIQVVSSTDGSTRFKPSVAVVSQAPAAGPRRARWPAALLLALVAALGIGAWVSDDQSVQQSAKAAARAAAAPLRPWLTANDWQLDDWLKNVPRPEVKAETLVVKTPTNRQTLRIGQEIGNGLWLASIGSKSALFERRDGSQVILPLTSSAAVPVVTAVDPNALESPPDAIPEGFSSAGTTDAPRAP